MRPYDDLGSRIRRTGAPATIGLVLAMAVVYVLAWFGLRGVLGAPLAFEASRIGAAPWTILTYPFASLGSGSDLIWFLFGLLWLWFMGGGVEREIGPRWLLGAFFGFTLLMAAAVGIGALAGPAPALMGAMLPTAALTMMWAGRHPEQSILLMMVIPLKGKYLAVLTAVLVVFGMGSGSPVVGFIAAVPLALAWFWALGRLPLAYPSAGSRRGPSRAERKAEERRQFEFREAVRKREQEREERERLRKLFESSLDPDDDR